MKISDSPKKQPTPFAINGPRDPIIDSTPPGENSASYNDGFPEITMTLKSAGGLPPKGENLNQVIFELSSLCRWFSAGCNAKFDSSFCTSINGYPIGSYVMGDDNKTVYRSTIDDNKNNPNNVVDGWSRVADDISDIIGFTSFGIEIPKKNNSDDVLSYLGLPNKTILGELKYTTKSTYKIPLRFPEVSLNTQINNNIQCRCHPTYLQYVELISENSDYLNTTFVIEGDIVSGSLGDGVQILLTGMDDLNRTNSLNYRTVITQEPGVFIVKIDTNPTPAPPPEQRNLFGISIRAIPGKVGEFELKKIKQYQSGVLIASTNLSIISPVSEWGGGSRSTLTVNNYQQTILINPETSFMMSSGSVIIDESSYNNPWSPSFTLDFFVKNIETQSSSARIGSNILFKPGRHYRYRASTSLPISRDLNLIAPWGEAIIMSGVELPTSSWISVQSGQVSVKKAPYNSDANPDAAIRAGTKQPFLSVLVPGASDVSQRNFSFTSASSVSEVLASPRKYYFDGSYVYFSFNGNESCYVYIAEADNGVSFENTSTPSMVRASGIHVMAPKVNPWNFYASSYANWRTSKQNSNRFISLYNCKASASFSGSGGFAFSNIDSELINCISDSTFSDGFNFHDAGESLVIGGYARCSGDDGISHHESCVAYVRDFGSMYSGASYGVPAYGANVLFENCYAKSPSAGNTGKIYQNTWAVLSGVDNLGNKRSASATYINCQGDNQDKTYSVVSQSAGCVANLNVMGVISSTRYSEIVKYSGSSSDLNVNLKY